jgi:hypothetical protein
MKQVSRHIDFDTFPGHHELMAVDTLQQPSVGVLVSVSFHLVVDDGVRMVRVGDKLDVPVEFSQGFVRIEVAGPACGVRGLGAGLVGDDPALRAFDLLPLAISTVL